jgi:hypothetical protein
MSGTERYGTDEGCVPGDTAGGTGDRHPFLLSIRTVPLGVWILYLATATVLIHDGIVTQRWWMLIATVLDVVGMTIVLALPERRGA